MRKTLLPGLVLALAVMAVVLLGDALDLGLGSVALLGAAMGAVVVLVPDRTPGARLCGFAVGFVVAWVGYLVRAQMLPDTGGGRAVAVGLVVLLCVGIVAASGDRLTLWSVLLGAGAFAGAYELTYDQAPPEVLSTSVSTATTMALDVAIGFLAAAFVAPAVTSEARKAPREDLPERHGSSRAVPPDVRLDDMLKESGQ
ncbi:MAG TPA: hypothetical protein VFM09_04990 [Marmoricola sp.]|nr:hypothetical protein [Marmoricola sp.]